MDASRSTSAHNLTSRGLLVILVGLATIALPEAAAGAAGLALLYAIAGLAVISGGMNLLNAFRVREVAGWLLPVSALVLALGFALLASPVGLGVALTRVLGTAVVVAGGFTVARAIRRAPSDRAGAAPLPAAR